MGLSRGIKTLPESKASTRYSDLDTVDVLLLSKMRSTGSGRELVFLDGSRITVPSPCKDRRERRKIAAAIMRNTVRVAEYLAPEPTTAISWAKPFVYTGSREDDEEPFRVAIVGRDDEIVGTDGSRANAHYALHYNSESGYIGEKEE